VDFRGVGPKLRVPLSERAVVLLVEDRKDDVFLVRRAFKQAGISNPVHVAPDGQEAIDYLAGHGKYSDRSACPLPDLVLLDLKLPRLNGFEVLRWIRQRPAFRELKVVVLTSSQDIRDINLAYRLGANSFLVKPMDFTDYIALAGLLADNWFNWGRANAVGQRDEGQKVLLRDRSSRCFYSERATWVAEKHQALDFERVELAQAVAAAQCLDTAEVVLAYDEPHCELTLPVGLPA